MKRLLVIFFVSIGLNGFATEWAWYYIYIQTEYMQGPWTRAAIFDKSGNHMYLHPKRLEELFGSEPEDMANAILHHLQKENPERYAFKCALSVVSDTVVIQTNEPIAGFDVVKNELTASFTLNNFNTVKIIQQGQAAFYQLKDIDVPYMDLVLPQERNPVENIREDTLAKEPGMEKENSDRSENKVPFLWLAISVLVNLLLAALLLGKKSKGK